MSTSIFWRPGNKGKSMERQLKYIFNSAGLFQNRSVETLTYDHISLLKGIKAGNQDDTVKSDVQILIDEIEHSGSVEIYLA